MRAKRNRHPFYDPPCTFFNELCYPDSNADILAAYEVFRKRRDKFFRSGKIEKIAAMRKQVLSRLVHNQIAYVDARGEIIVYKGFKALLAKLEPDETRENMVVPFVINLVDLSVRFAAIGGEVCPFISDDALRSERGDLADSIRELIVAAEASKTNWPEEIQSFERGTKLVREWLFSLSDEDLISLGFAAADCLEGVDLKAIQPADCDIQIVKMEKYAQSIYPHLQASIKGYSALADRMDMWDANVNESIESLENQEGISGLWILAKQGTFAFSVEMLGKIERSALVDHQRDLIQESFDACLYFAFNQWFWHIAIYQILAHHGAIENHRVTEWGKFLLKELWTHPSKLNRVPVVDPAGYKCRTALCKFIVPCIREFMSCKHANELRREFGLVKDSCDEIKDISISLFLRILGVLWTPWSCTSRSLKDSHLRTP